MSAGARSGRGRSSIRRSTSRSTRPRRAAAASRRHRHGRARSTLAYRLGPGALGRAREPARPAVRREAAERRPRRRRRRGVRLDLRAGAGDGRRPRSAATRPPHASRRARRAAAAPGSRASASRRRGSRSARSTRLLDGPREVRFRDAAAVLPPATLAALVTTRPGRGRLRVGLDVPRASGRSSLRSSAASSVQPVDARFVVDGSRVRVVPASPGTEARRRADRAVARHEPRGAGASGAVPRRPSRR